MNYATEFAGILAELVAAKIVVGWSSAMIAEKEWGGLVALARKIMDAAREESDRVYQETMARAHGKSVAQQKLIDFAKENGNG